MLVLGTGLLALGGCGPKVTVESAWMAPGIQARPVQSVMVVGIARNAGLRGTYESLAAQTFGEHGASALRSLDVLPPSQAITKEAVAQAIEGRDIEAIFATRLLDVQTSQQYVPPTTTSWGYPGYYRDFWGYYPAVSVAVMEPGYFVEVKTYLLESSLWNATTGEIVWSAQTSVVDPNKPAPAFERLMAKLVQELEAADLLAPAP